MMKSTLLAVILAVCAGLAQASQEVVAERGDVLTLRDDYPETYVVQKGDTLWAISGMFLEDPWLWPELWHFNPQVENPHLIFPGDVLRLQWVDGRPRLVREPTRDVKLSPHMRISDLDEAIPALPLDQIGPFLRNNRIVTNDTLEGAPYVLIGRDGNIIAGAGSQVYARGHFQEHRIFDIVRRGMVYQDPESGEVLGLEARDIGTGRRVATEGDIATLSLERSAEEIRRADRLLPVEDRRLRARFIPQAPQTAIHGHILAVDRGLNQVGNMSVVTISRGEHEGLREGDVLAIYRTGDVVHDEVTGEAVRVPDLRAGLMMVFRTFDRVSYGLVLRAQHPMKVGDRVANP
jgi:hypothetical protein